MNDLSSMASTVGGLLKARGQTVAVAESSAGGLISAALLAVPGASAYFLGGSVIYTQAARRALLRVPDEAMAGMRSSSEPYALLKARAVRELLGTTWGLSETGASGPTGNRYGDAAGHACIAVAGPRRARHHSRDRPARSGGQHVAIHTRGARAPRTLPHWPRVVPSFTLRAG